MKKKCFLATVGVWLASFCVFYMIGMIVFPVDEATNTLQAPTVFIFVLFFAPIALALLFKHVRYPKKSDYADENSSAGPKTFKDAWNTPPQKQKNLFNGHAKLQLVGGLADLPQGSTCKATYNTDKIAFTESGQEFVLDAEKMLDVSVMTEKDIQNQYVSSSGGALAGAMLLGPLGAIIGGTAKKKILTTKRLYLVFTYLSDAETKYIVFDVTTNAAAGSNIKAVYSYLKKNKKVKVEL